MAERHRLKQRNFFTVWFVDGARNLSILLHQHLGYDVLWIVLIVGAFIVGVRWILHSHQLGLLSCAYLARVRAAQRVRGTAGRTCLRFLLCVEILASMLLTMGVRCTVAVSRQSRRMPHRANLFLIGNGRRV